MTREEKLEAIYETMANKELTFGCKVRFDKGIYTIIDEKNVGFLDSYRGKDGNIHNTIVIEDCINSRCYSIEEIIGHPVMIGDVIDYTGEKKIDIVWSDSSCAIDIRDGENSLNLFNLWGNKRTPIEDQSDECIDFIYSLIGNKNE